MAAHEDLAACANRGRVEPLPTYAMIHGLLASLSASFSSASAWLLGPLVIESSVEAESAAHYSVGNSSVGNSADDSRRAHGTLILTGALGERVRLARQVEGTTQRQQCLRTGADVAHEVIARLTGADGCDWLVGMQAGTSEEVLDRLGRKSFSSLARRLCELVEAHLLRTEMQRMKIIEEAIWDRSHDGLVLVASNGACVRANRTASELVGRPEGEMVHLAARDWLPAPLGLAPKGLLSFGAWRGRLVTESGNGRSVEIAQSQIACADETFTLVQLADRNDIVTLESQLEKLQRHRLMGRLSGGVVHDLNNLLTVIVAALEVAERNPSSTYLPEMITDAHEAVRRCESLCRQLLTMGRHRPGAVRVIAPDATIAGMRKLMERTVPDDAEFSLSLKASGASIALRIGALEQILLNLLVNAREALVSKKGAISVSTCIEDNRFHLLVTDRGRGMSEVSLQQVFEPSNSTKQQSGIGLAIAHALVAKVGGQIDVRSCPDKGTSYDASFALALEDSSIETSLARPGYDAKIRGEGRIVLLCENEAVLRDVIHRALSQQGYEVVSSSDGRRGLELIEGGFAIDALVTDLVMPKVGGTEIAQACNRNGRQTPVVFVSGLLEQEALPELGAPTQFLAKPFRMHDLLGALQAVLRKD